MDQPEIYVLLLGIIVGVGWIFRNSSVPITLILVIVGMAASFIPDVPPIRFNPHIILNIFLPLLIYRISAESSWRDFKINLFPIASLSVGHVIFITIIAAITIHTLLPELGWALAFILGAVIAPPDDVAIIPIAEKSHMPHRIVTILKGEAMLNDATALTIFRFALAALVTHEFSATHAMEMFFAVIIGETLYGLIIGHLIGEIRMRIRDPMLQMILSIITPFIAYYPAVNFGGCGILATVVTGFVIGHRYLEKLTPEGRLLGRAVWRTIEFTIQCILFLLIGLDMRFIVERISSIPNTSLLLYSSSIVLVVILGRFVWVYFFTYLPNVIATIVKKKEKVVSWRSPFIVSWAGMRGSISLAAALAVPILPATINGANPRDLLVFLVFCVIVATLLLQGLTLPWVLKKVGVHSRGQHEKYHEHVAEISTRLKMVKAALRWLLQYKKTLVDSPELADEVMIFIREYRLFKSNLEKSAKNHNETFEHEDIDLDNQIFMLNQITEIQRTELLRLWHEGKINLTVKNKLLAQLDHQSERFT